MVDKVIERYYSVLTELSLELTEIRKNPKNGDVELQDRIVAFRSLPIVKWKLPRLVDPLVLACGGMINKELIYVIINLINFNAPVRKSVIREISITGNACLSSSLELLQLVPTQYIQSVPLFD